MWEPRKVQAAKMQPQSCLVRSLVRWGWSLHAILMGMDTTTNTESRKLPPQNLELDRCTLATTTARFPSHPHRFTLVGTSMGPGMVACPPFSNRGPGKGDICLLSASMGFFPRGKAGWTLSSQSQPIPTSGHHFAPSEVCLKTAPGKDTEIPFHIKNQVEILSQKMSEKQSEITLLFNASNVFLNHVLKKC